MADEGLEERIQALEEEVAEIKDVMRLSGSDVPTKEGNKPKSLPEFKQEFTPSTYAEKALVVGEYLEIHKGREQFTVSELKEGFKTCKWQLPSNLSDTVGKAAGRHGYFMEVGKNEEGENLWMLTETGEKHLREQVRGDE